LSALDAEVAQHIFKECIVKAMHGKTRVLVTHRIPVLAECDYIVSMSHGSIKYQGDIQSLLSQNAEFISLNNEYGNKQQPNVRDGEAPWNDKPEPVTTDEHSTHAMEDLLQDEERDSGSVSLQIYKYYLSLAGGPFRVVSLSVFMALLVQSVRIGTDVWLEIWTASFESSQRSSAAHHPLWLLQLPNVTYVYVYAGFALAQGIVGFLYGFSFSFIGAHVSKRLHNKMMHSLVRAPCSFFDTTPLGRILNRYTREAV
jgi:ABC-type multidrug transport system fused ATPase/permease subunit